MSLAVLLPEVAYIAGQHGKGVVFAPERCLFLPTVAEIDDEDERDEFYTLIMQQLRKIN